MTGRLYDVESLDEGFPLRMAMLRSLRDGGRVLGLWTTVDEQASAVLVECRRGYYVTVGDRGEGEQRCWVRARAGEWRRALMEGQGLAESLLGGPESLVAWELSDSTGSDVPVVRRAP